MCVIQWIDSNDGFVMCMLTAIYVLVTILIFFSNNKSTKLAEKGIKSNYELQLYDSRMIVANKISQGKYEDIDVQIKILFSDEIFQQAMQNRSLKERLLKLKEDEKRYRYEYASIIKDEYEELMNTGTIYMTLGEFEASQTFRDEVDILVQTDEDEYEMEHLSYNTITKEGRSIKEKLEREQEKLDGNILNYIRNAYIIDN